MPRKTGVSQPPPIDLMCITSHDEKSVIPDPAVDDESQHIVSRWLNLADGALANKTIRKTG